MRDPSTLCLPSLCILANSLLASVLSTDVASAQFVESELVFPVPIDSRSALPNVDNGIGMILLTGRSDNGDKHLALHEVTQEKSVRQVPVAALDISPEILFFDTGSILGRTSIVFLGSTGLSRLNLVAQRLESLLEISSVYRAPSNAPLMKSNFLFDVNQDGLEDIVVPDFSGLKVALQVQNGFAEPELLELSPRLRLNAGAPHYLPDTIYLYDFTLDGLKDLAVIRDNIFLVFERREHGFTSSPISLPIDIELASDSSAENFQRNALQIDQSDFQYSRIFRVVDLNSDSLPDIITFTTISSGLFDKRSAYHIHLGRNGSHRVYYAPLPDAKIPSDGFQVDLVAVDVENNGRQDLVSTSFRLGFTELVIALFSRSINLDVSLHRMDGRFLYSEQPEFQTDVKVRFSLSTGFVNSPAVRFADFNGDSRLDLILQDSSERLLIREGTIDGGGFNRRAIEWATFLPRDGALIEVVDANGDLGADLLIGYGASDGEDMRNRVRVLISDP